MYRLCDDDDDDAYNHDSKLRYIVCMCTFICIYTLYVYVGVCMCDDDSTIYDSGETIYCGAPPTASDRLCNNRLHCVLLDNNLAALRRVGVLIILLYDV